MEPAERPAWKERREILHQLGVWCWDKKSEYYADQQSEDEAVEAGGSMRSGDESVTKQLEKL